MCIAIHYNRQRTLVCVNRVLEWDKCVALLKCKKRVEASDSEVSFATPCMLCMIIIMMAHALSGMVVGVCAFATPDLTRTTASFSNCSS